MSFSVTINYGSDDVTLTDYSGENLLLADSFKKTTNVQSTSYKHETSKASFSFLSKPSLVSTLFGLPRDQLISVSIQEDGVEWFTGYVRPTGISFTDSPGHAANNVSFECVDSLWILQDSPSSYISRNPDDSMTVCDTSTTGQSLIHWLLEQAGFTGTINAYDITDDIEWFLMSPDENYIDVLNDICFSHHCTFYPGDDGSFNLYDWGEAAADISVSGTIDEDDILGDLKISRESTEIKTPTVEYYNLVRENEVQVSTYTDFFGLDEDGSQIVFEDYSGQEKWSDIQADYDWQYCTAAKTIPAEFTFPDGAVGIIDFKLEVIGRPSWIWSYGYLYAGSLRTKTVDLPASGSKIPGNFRTAVTSEIDESDYTASYVLKWSSSSDYYSSSFESISTLADLYLREKAGTADGKDIGNGTKTYKGLYCYNESAAKALATALSSNLEYGEFKHTFESENDYTPGGYYTLENDQANISAVVRIVKKTEKIISSTYRKYEYECRQYSGFSALVELITEGTGSTSITKSNRMKSVVGSDLEAAEDLNVDESGLYMFSDVMGFYNETSEKWTAYIKNDGSFLFQGDSNNYILWDGSKLSVHGDFYLSGDSELNGTVTTGNGIKSSDYNAGVAGWKIDGDGNAEFNTITIRKEAFEAIMTGYETALMIGFGGEGSLSSPGEGDRGILIDEDEISWKEITDEEFSNYNPIRIGGVDSDGIFWPFFSCRGVINPQGDIDDVTELLPGGHLYTFEDDLLDQDDEYELSYNQVERSTVWSKFGSYCLKTVSGGTNGYVQYDSSTTSDLSLLNLAKDQTVSQWFCKPNDGEDPYLYGVGFMYIRNVEGSTTTVLKVVADVANNTYYLQITQTGINSLTGNAVSLESGVGHNIAVTWDASEKTAYLIADGEIVDTLDASSSGLVLPSEPTTINYFGTTYTDVDDPDDPGFYIDQLLIVPGELIDADALIQHYNHNREWNTKYSDKDAFLLPALGGKSRISYQMNDLTGCQCTPGTDSEHDVAVSAGHRRSSNDGANLDFKGGTAAIDATFSESGTWGLFPGASLSAGDTAHLFLVRMSDGNTGLGFDDNISCSNGGYSYCRRVGSRRVLAGPVLAPARQFGNYNELVTAVNDWNLQTVSTSQVNRALSCIPKGKSFLADIAASINNNSSTTTYVLFGSPYTTLPTPDAGICDMRTADGSADSTRVIVPTNPDAEIAYIAAGDTSLSAGFRGTPVGWYDDLGVFDGV